MTPRPQKYYPVVVFENKNNFFTQPPQSVTLASPGKITVSVFVQGVKKNYDDIISNAIRNDIF